jgi:HSP20 family protein
MPKTTGKNGTKARPPAPPARWEPMRELEDMRARMDRLVESLWRAPGGDDEAGWSPAVDIEETDDAWLVKAELPGVQPDDVSVELSDGELRITGEVSEEKQREGRPQRRMRRMGRFEYRTSVPADAKPDDVDAKLDNGVLTVRVGRSERAEPRRIEVKAT